MTERLFYTDSHQAEFTAEVTACEPAGDKWYIELDATAFFPEGGGQPGDTGWLNGIPVLDTKEDGERVLHVCAEPLSAGSAVQGKLDWPLRFARMQEHSAEHILSGLAHRLWGCRNVGFHMPGKDVTIDFDRELSDSELKLLERKANETVWANLPVRGFFPTEEELQTLSWRQKKELQGPIRLVEIQGVDLCACCVPHVTRTGEIGPILITDAMRHRGGMRLTMRAGTFALETILQQKEDAAALSRAFSAPKDALPEAADRVLQELEQRKMDAANAERSYTALLLRSTSPAEGNLLFFENASLSGAAMRELADGGAEKTQGICGGFAGEDGAWRYNLCSRHVDLRSRAKEINGALGGRGGGSAEMIQGSCTAGRPEIEKYFTEMKDNAAVL